MKNKRLLRLSMLLSLLILVLGIPVQAQSPCNHVVFRLETTATVDQQAICKAAQPWDEQGIRIFIFLTDAVPANEGEWFDMLDQVEADAGLRDLSQADDFDTSTLALEASTANVPFAATLTYGERLFDTPLDQSESERLRLASDLRNSIQEDNPTEGFVRTLENAYAINYPPPSPFLIGTGVVVILLVLGGVGFVVYQQLLRPAQQRARQRRRIQEQLDRLQTSIANLLLALERLLAGKTPEETVLYQLFEAYGGTHYDDRRKAIHEWLRRSQAALRNAFDLRRELQSEEVQQSQSLEQQVQNWEMIYLTLVGSRPDILNLTNDELRDLLDPMVIFEREGQDVQLVEQLNSIRRQIEGMALKVELIAVDPEKTDQEGILGYIDQIEEQLSELMAAQQAAPESLEEARRARLEAEEAATSASPFGMKASQMFSEIDKRLIQTENDLQAGIYLRAIEGAETLLRDLEIIADLIDAAAEHGERQDKIDAITDQGYRPASLAADKQEIEEDINNIIQMITSGDYLAADTWIDELDADSQRALVATEAWKQQQQFNKEALGHLHERISRFQAYLEEEARPAWANLLTYPQGNWEDVTHGPEQPAHMLHTLSNEVLPHIEQLNSLEVQQVPEAREALVQAEADLAQTKRQIQDIVNRLAEVQAAEANISEGIRLAEADLKEAISLRDAEDSKIGPEVDQLLAEAANQLEQARRLTDQRLFIGAMEAQTAARNLATEAYASASEQIQNINALQQRLENVRREVTKTVDNVLTEGEHLSPLAQTAETNRLLEQAKTQISTARQAQAATMSQHDHALAAALTMAIDAFTAAGQVAEQAQARVATDRAAYNKLLQETREQISRAKSAIERAARKVNHPDARGAGEQALSRAAAVLPAENAIAAATREALSEIQRNALLAQEYAREAERKAEQAIDEVQRRRARASWTVLGGPSWSGRGSGWPSNPGWSGSSRSSNRSSSRSSSRPSWSSSRSSSSSSSRRSSSSSMSRRSSLGGGSRRTSSSGRSRR